ncbi:MAG: hypothetical protein CVU09_04930 [Bacteroidetes bacterium HGW-Bacteroidetes-4]|nr:MAG: hypothetical protein CVU09_04930 [Bacteroidetes bacterium HGW-Bacteroidetes-4]
MAPRLLKSDAKVVKKLFRANIILKKNDIFFLFKWSPKVYAQKTLNTKLFQGFSVLLVLF